MLLCVYGFTGQTPLHDAASLDAPLSVRILLEYGADIGTAIETADRLDSQSHPRLTLHFRYQRH